MSWPVFIDSASLLEKIEATGSVVRHPDNKNLYVENFRVFLGTHDITWMLSDNERWLGKEYLKRKYVNEEAQRELEDIRKQVNATKID